MLQDQMKSLMALFDTKEVEQRQLNESAEPKPVTTGHFADKKYTDKGLPKPYPKLKDTSTGKTRSHPADKSVKEATDQTWTVEYTVEPKSYGDHTENETFHEKTVKAGSASEAVEKVKASTKRGYDFKAHASKESVDESMDASEDAVRVRGGRRFLFPEDGKFGYATDGGDNQFTILDQETGEVRDISLDKLLDNPLQADLEHLVYEYDDEQFTSGKSVPDWLKKASGMWNEDSGKQVDMTGKKCTACKKGTYEETSQHDDMDGVLHCTKCRKEVKRHQPAKPVSEDAAPVKYGVFSTGGSVGSQRFKDDPIKTFDDKEAAKAFARERRKGLSKGERGYYRMSYVVKAIKGE